MVVRLYEDGILNLKIKLSVKELVCQTGDSTLHSYNFSNGLLIVSLELFDHRDVIIEIPTTAVRGEQFPTEENRYRTDRTCYLWLEELEGILKVNENGFYIPSSNFGRMMREIRSGASLAYGQRVTEVKWLLRFVGYSPSLVSCTVADLDQIVCTIDEV